VKARVNLANVNAECLRSDNYGCAVTLNGEPELHAIEADDHAGYVIRAKRDGRGHVIWPIQYERVEGVVVLTPNQVGD
jgi:hypothetical protein